PNPLRVARRALALKAVTKRAVLEQDPHNPKSHRVHRDLLSWVKEIGIGEELEAEEWEVLQRPLGRLDARQQIDSNWRLEVLVVLAWALSRYDIPSYDQLVNMNSLWRSLGLLSAKGASELLANPMPRSREDVCVLRNRLFALHWRLVNFMTHGGVLDFA